MTGSLLPQVIVNGLVAGCLFALLGLGFGLIYNTTQILHFAHGIVYTASAYVLFLLYGRLDLGLVPSLAVASIAAGALGLGIFEGIYRPLRARGASGLILMIGSTAVFLLLENLVALVFGNDSQVVAKGVVEAGYQFGSVVLTPVQVTTLVAGPALLAAVMLSLKTTRVGKALRGLACDAFMARVVGIPTGRLERLVFLVGSLLAFVAAALVALDTGVRPDMGLIAVLLAAVAVIVGGIGNLYAGVLGGFLIGLAQNLGILYFSPKLQNMITFGILLAFLLFRPTGLVGRRA